MQTQPIWAHFTVRARSFRYNYKSPHNFKPMGRPRSPSEYGPAEYPPVKTRWPPGSWDTVNRVLPEHTCWMLHRQREELNAIPKVKQRLERLAGEKGQIMWLVRPFELHSGEASEDFLKFITRTHIIEQQSGLPDAYKGNSKNIDDALHKVKGPVIEAILQEHEYQYIYELSQGELSHDLLNHPGFHARRQVSLLANTILSCLAADHPHLLRAQVDEDVRVETFWRSQGFKDFKIGNKFYGIIPFQYQHMADWQLRTELPLSEVVSEDHQLCIKGDFPPLEFSMRSVGLSRVKSRPTTISGHWVGDPCEFTSLSMHVLPAKQYESLRGKYGDEPMRSIEQKFGLASAFGSCVSQAHNQGFNWLLDLTYPLTTQSVITVDGSWFKFFTYQLNTLEMWKTKEANSKCNLLWMTDRIKLYDVVEGGQVKGFDDEALKMLLQCFLNKPVERGIDLRPYLPEDDAPRNKKLFINHVGEEPLPFDKPERFQYPPNAVYF